MLALQRLPPALLGIKIFITHLRTHHRECDHLTACAYTQGLERTSCFRSDYFATSYDTFCRSSSSGHTLRQSFSKSYLASRFQAASTSRIQASMRC